MKKLLAAGSLAVFLLTSAPAFSQAVKVDENLETYKSTSGVSGRLNSVGSDTLNNLMTLWAEGFRTSYPNVKTQIEGKGSSTAPPALINGTAQIGPMSRKMKKEEVDKFESEFGYEPTRVAVAIDALAVYVNKDNPIDKLTIEQVDAMFSKSRECGSGDDIKTWGDLGATGAWANKPISLYGRNSASGTYGYFKKVALCKGDYRDTVKEQPGSSSVVQGVTEDRYGVGYSGIGYKTSGVKALHLSKDGKTYYSTEPKDVMSGSYPLARSLYLYLNRAPNEPTDKLSLEFFKFVLSSQGQTVVVKDGYLPLTAPLAKKELAKLD